MAKGKKNKKTTLDMPENIEALLTYVFTWVTGIVFLILEKKSKFVKFHAMQSLIAFLGLTMFTWIFALIPIVGSLLETLTAILILVLWIVMMVKAYQGEEYKLPIVGDIAEEFAKEK